MMTKKILLLCWLSQFVFTVGSAQINITRNLLFNYPEDTVLSQSRFFRQTHFLGELNSGSGSANEEQKWNIKLIGAFEIFRWKKAVLTGSLAAELAANPHNDISFNPQTVIWHEQIQYLQQSRLFTWGISVFHRCKHEIDNALPPKENMPLYQYKPETRILILSGLQAEISARPLKLSSKLKFNQAIRLENYFIRYDYRNPDNDLPADWENAIGSIQWIVRANYQVSSDWKFFVKGFISPMFFNNENLTAEWNGRAETGIRFSGTQAGIEIFAAWEHFFDDYSSVVPTKSSVTYIGLRINPNVFL